MSALTEFIEKAKGLTKNPLGIIALFISLIYGFACLVLSTSLKNLQGQAERLPLIWFIILFPAFILIGFIYLVVHHHEKLYAPSDYKDEANFIKTLDAKNQTRRLQKEVEAIKEDIEETIADSKKITDKTITKTEQVDKTKTIQNKYLIAEELALRAFEQDRKLSVKRQSKIVGSQNRAIEFDAIAFDYLMNSIYGIDVKFTVHRHLTKTLKNRVLNDITYYSEKIQDLNFNKDFKLVFIIVTESDNHLSLESELKVLNPKEPLGVYTIVYGFDELKQRFGIQ